MIGSTALYGVGCGLAMNISSSLIGTSFRTSRVDSFSQVRRSRHFGSLKGVVQNKKGACSKGKRGGGGGGGGL